MTANQEFSLMLGSVIAVVAVACLIAEVHFRRWKARQELEAQEELNGDTPN